MDPAPPELPSGLLATFAAFDRTFSEDRGSDLADFFSENARLMWPDTEDIVGRDAIRAAFEEFVSAFTTIKWNPDRAIIHQLEHGALVVGRFTEDRAPRAGGPADRVFGRLVEIWIRQHDGSWKLDLLLTGRYAENEPLS